MSSTNKLPDPHGLINNIKRRLNPACAVARSPFVDHIIAQRLQGIPYLEIEKWLIDQEPKGQHRIASPTIWKNFKKIKIDTQLPYAEELAEKFGGRIDLDLTRELSGQIMAQRERISALQRAEAEKRNKGEKWHDKSIAWEIDRLNELCRTLIMHLKPAGAQQGATDEKLLEEALAAQMSPAGLLAVKDLILKGDLKINQQLS